jgi:hypothetical protein
MAEAKTVRRKDQRRARLDVVPFLEKVCIPVVTRVHPKAR